MAATIFDRILKRAAEENQLLYTDDYEEQRDAENWLAKRTKELTTKSTASRLLSDKDRKKKRIQPGRMYLFKYDPKGKETLPYYDTLPLVFPIETFSGGFLGVNFHYLPLPMRAELMRALVGLQNNDDLDETTRLIVSYKILNSYKKFRTFRPALKKYLNSHIKTDFIRIEAHEWEIAIFLPIEKFQKATKTQVWRDSRKSLRK